MYLTHRLIELLKYAIKGKSRFYLHSPFVYKFAEEILTDNRHFYAFDDIEIIKKKLLSNNSEILVQDLGERKNQTKKRKVNSIAKNTSIATRYGQLLFRMLNHFQPKNMLELGTSFGISSLYHSKGNLNGNLTTIEGCPEIAKIAKGNFNLLNVDNIEVVIGNFDECLEDVLKNLGSIDYVFFDGNHQKEATLNYFNSCLKYANENSIFVFDDIHWSPDMTSAWNEVIQHPKVQISMDFYQIGILFFHQSQAKEDFKLWYW